MATAVKTCQTSATNLIPACSTALCTSRTSGLTCHNPGDHGFFMSREKLRVF